jgi:hypothetical protein
MKYLVFAVGTSLGVAAIAAPSGSIPEVSAVCKSQALAMAKACPLGKDATAFLACKKQHGALVSAKCSAEMRSHITALAASCRRGQAPQKYAAVCPTFKAHPKAF